MHATLIIDAESIDDLFPAWQALADAAGHPLDGTVKLTATGQIIDVVIPATVEPAADEAPADSPDDDLDAAAETTSPEPVPEPDEDPCPSPTRSRSQAPADGDPLADMSCADAIVAVVDADPDTTFTPSDIAEKLPWFQRSTIGFTLGRITGDRIERRGRGLYGSRR